MDNINNSTPFSTYNFLLLSFLCSFLVWLVQWHWSRRKLYKYASKVHGPFAFPLFGSAHYFIGNPYVIYKNIQYIFTTWPRLCKVWFGHRLFYAVADPKYMDIILNHPKAIAKEMLYVYAEKVVGLGLFTASPDDWKRHRKIIRPTFNQKILDSFVEVFAEQGEILAKQLKNHTEKDLDLFNLISRATLDIICETAMGVQVHAQTSDSLFGKWADSAMEIVFLRMFVITYHFDWIFNFSKHKQVLDDAVKNMHEFSGKVVVNKRKTYEKLMMERKLCPEAEIEEDIGKRKAFLDYLIEVTHSDSSSGNKMTDEELRQEVDTFMVAERCYEEVLDIIGPDRPVQADDLPKLKYLECVIKETLRLFPVGAFIVRAIEDDIDLGDVTLPAGSSAVMGIMNVHRDPEYWPNPLKFDPERFSPDKTIVPGSYLPFSLGPRNCIGIKYAMMTMKSLMASVLRKYTIYTHYKTIEDVELKTNLVLRPRDGFQVFVESRE